MNLPPFDSRLRTSAPGLDPVRAAISRAAERTGMDFTYLVQQARSESGLNPNARATTSSATGLYQFIDQSWLGVLKQHGAKHGMTWAANAIQRGPNGRYTVNDPDMRRAVFALREQAEPAALMAGEFARENAEGLQATLGRAPNSADLYFAHFLGLAGAKRFLQARDAAPDSAAANFFPKEASVNHTIFYQKSGVPRTLDQVYQLMARKIGADETQPVAYANAGQAGSMPDTWSDVAGALGAGEMNSQSAQNAFDAAPDMVAILESRNFDSLRPNPKTAQLAYLLLSADINDPTIMDI